MNLFNNNIKFMHFRQFNKDGTINARGGMTVAYYEDKPGEFIWAMSRCSDKDNFCKQEGRLLAVKRLKSENINTGILSTVEFRGMIDKMISVGTTFQRSFGKKRKTKLVAVA